MDVAHAPHGGILLSFDSYHCLHVSADVSRKAQRRRLRVGACQTVLLGLRAALARRFVVEARHAQDHHSGRLAWTAPVRCVSAAISGFSGIILRSIARRASAIARTF